jgi:hypothetical protein
MFALTVISFDQDLSKKTVKSELLLALHALLFRIFQERFRYKEASRKQSPSLLSILKI